MSTDVSKRILRLLTLLQTPREMPGSELARQLHVSPRTIRRDVDHLRDLGYSVEASQGAAGGYRLMAGPVLPPLLLEDEEAVAIGVALRIAVAQATEGVEEASVQALTKLQQVLPLQLHDRVESLSGTTLLRTRWHESPAPSTLTFLATAAAARERLRFGYREVDGTERSHLVEPESLLFVGHSWYLLAYDGDLAGWSIFRVERVKELHLTGGRFTPQPLPAQDAASYVAERVSGGSPSAYRAEVTLLAPYEKVASNLGDPTATVEKLSEDSCRLSLETDSLEWLVARLSVLGCDFEVDGPPELVVYLRDLSERISRAASPHGMSSGGA
ncbi:WYL domain-containing protein [Streptomyces europaeiscabiei]|nr:WYL domain-containing protein [Streptomyces europaeiscabiei]